MRFEPCSSCYGRGQIYVEGWVPCVACGGSGQIMRPDPPTPIPGQKAGGRGGGGTYRMESVTAALLERVPRAASLVLAAIGVLVFVTLAQGTAPAETGFLVFSGVLGGLIGLCAIPLLILLLDLSIKIVRVILVLALLGAVVIAIDYLVNNSG